MWQARHLRYCHFYPRSPCGERPRRIHTGPARGNISIHALLAESDRDCLCGITESSVFLSTLSLRRATWQIWMPMLLSWDFYPRSPCGERQSWATRARAAQLFLSTLSLRRATYSTNYVQITFNKFLSTLSLRRATPPHSDPLGLADISIHALLAESDVGPITHSGHPLYNFYPRSPCGERRAREGRRGAKPRTSIHALLAESDRHWQTGQSRTRQLLSTLSLRRATRPGLTRYYPSRNFYPRSPCGERPVCARFGVTIPCNFYPRSPCGERQVLFL